MTSPRQIVPGRYWMVTRRCTQRQFLLRPSKATTQHFLYCLALAAQRSGVRVIAFLAMSNHYHAVVRDPFGRLPVFVEHLNKLVARSLNAHYGRWENFWSTEAACLTHLVDAADVIDKVLYLLANPVADHLVERLIEWPGANSYAAMRSGERMEIERPPGFFREDGPTPAIAALELERPPGFDRHATHEFAKFLETSMRIAEANAKAERAERGIRPIGVKAVLATSPFDSPQTNVRRRNLHPAVACKNVANRIRALSALVAFRRAYYAARRKLAAGLLKVLFPPGSYRVRMLLGDDVVEPTPTGPVTLTLVPPPGRPEPESLGPARFSI